MTASLPEKVDVLVAGAGTAGAAAALCCARRGMRVLCVDRRPLDAAGARWVNGVTGLAFDRVGIDRPSGDERVGSGDPFHLVAGWGPSRVVIDDHDVPEVDMRRLVERLQGLALEAGAVLCGEVAVEDVESRDVVTSAGRVRARWVIDASGLTGARLLDSPRVEGRDLCAAAQSVRELEDEDGARAFWDRHGVPFGQNLCFAGVAGGYSILNVSAHDGRVSLLTGSIPADGHPSGAAILRGFVDEQPWIGTEIFGGARPIPVRRPFDRLTDGRVAAIGDAASQVFPAHGSGIGAGMVAARMLGDDLAEGLDPHHWAARWQRSEGALFGAYDVFRRFSQGLSVAELERLMETGLMDARTARAGKAQVRPSLPTSALPSKARGLFEAGGLGARLSGAGARMAAVGALYRSYPQDPQRLPGWSRLAARLFGDAPDVRS